MQRKQILARVKVHLLLGFSITPQQCIAKFKGYRLSDVIFRLKKYGLKIETDIIKMKDGSSFARYRLVKPKQK